MAIYKQPKKPRVEKPIRFYPILPRRPYVKNRRKALENHGNFPTKYLKRVHADLWSKGSRTYEPDKINVLLPVTLGNCTQSSVNNPGWRLAVAKRTDASSSYSRELVSVRTSMYSCTSESANYLAQGFGVLAQAPVNTPKSWTTLEDQALSQIKRKLNGHIGQAQLLPPIAESREIHRLVRQINDLGIDAVKAMLALRKTKGASAFKFAADVWLGFGFGINPMLKDIESAATAILTYNERNDHYVRLTGTSSQDFSSGQVLKPDQFSEEIATGLTVGYSNSTNHKQGVQFVAGIYLTTRSAASYSVYDHLGLKVSEIPSALWELTPFSWAVDYFTTVSPWLDDMFFTLPGNTVFVSKARKYQSETTTDLLSFSKLGFTGRIGGGQSVCKYVSFTRTPMSSLPSRSLRIKSTDEIAQHSLTKLLNLSAVLAQFRGPKLTLKPREIYRSRSAF